MDGNGDASAKKGAGRFVKGWKGGPGRPSKGAIVAKIQATGLTVGLTEAGRITINLLASQAMRLLEKERNGGLTEAESDLAFKLCASLREELRVRAELAAILLEHGENGRMLLQAINGELPQPAKLEDGKP